MISVGGGIVLLCAAICGAIMSETRWVRLLSTLYLALFAIAVVVEIVRGRWDRNLLMVPILLLLLGMCAHGVHHMFDAKDEGKK